ncbi:RAD52 DNA repair protein RADC [Aspergillus clavatus NRRL 1]|uniref:RAD52 homolog n=1 Tax=Aspergillus clavatus (strain ATCC 1007 / CBS 513.65 / DSM 816 / NCTC 3887 / NRRL 1 / QM 1276 / 107) TaxID=344612 RepID=A1CH06_ASPCL|nr:RAD52 DNA repair protein RADC [Aspergillus clavatus NRRL 1]EAW10161.1 RAD52 DNA repair protein RADC [Aspergillus clavatus NRRL 1]
MPAVGDQHRGGPACVTMPNSTGNISSNPFEEPQRRISEYTAQEIATLQARLDKKLGPEYISSRPGAAGQKVHYLSADKCINLANEVFGFNGWSSSIQNIQIDFVEESQHTGKISLGLSVIVRVTLKDGTFHEDIGYGHIENCKGKAAAFEKAKKEGTTDALKRALRNFGNVLGNCIYDKDYVSKVTKVKAAPARWDVDELHRHPDFAPIKKEPIRPKIVPEDDDLPPRPATIVKNSSAINTAALDGDGEFGSDLFDEADFGVAATGNPDEVVLEPETRPRPQPPTPVNVQPFSRGAQGNLARPNPAVVTPSKPERPSYTNRQSSVPPAINGRPNPPAQQDQCAGQRRHLPQGPQQNFQNARVVPAVQSKTSQDSALSNTTAQVPIKREMDTRIQDTAPPASSPSIPPASFFSARAVDLLRENPHTAVTAPQFDPHAESPSIRKTAGVDHSKSVPISRPMLAGASPAANNTRDFINPSMDMHRKIGAPGVGPGSPMMNRSQTTSSYRPLTRQNIDPKQAVNGAVASRGAFGPPNTNGKRPPLNDVTNATASGGSGPVSVASANDPKRPRIDGNPAPSAPPQQQQQ